MRINITITTAFLNLFLLNQRMRKDEHESLLEEYLPGTQRSYVANFERVNLFVSIKGLTWPFSFVFHLIRLSNQLKLWFVCLIKIKVLKVITVLDSSRDSNYMTYTKLHFAEHFPLRFAKKNIRKFFFAPLMMQ